MARALDSQADALLPETPRGVEPLCAMYLTSCAPAIAAAMARGARKVTDGLAGLAEQHVGEAEWQALESAEVLLKNMNTPQDYEAARAKLDDEADGRRLRYSESHSG